MMQNWFECKVSYDKMMKNGMQKKVIEPYLVDALSFTEAEARIIEEITPYISGEFTVADIKRAKYSELFFSEEESADRWFKCKVIFIALDERSGAEKKTSTQMLVQASDLRYAVKKLDKDMKGTMADYEIASIAETQIMGVFPYSAEDDSEVLVEFEGKTTTVKKSILSQKTFELCFGELVVWFENRSNGIFAWEAGHWKDNSVKEKYVGKPLKYMHREKG